MRSGDYLLRFSSLVVLVWVTAPQPVAVAQPRKSILGLSVTLSRKFVLDITRDWRARITDNWKSKNKPNREVENHINLIQRSCV